VKVLTCPIESWRVSLPQQRALSRCDGALPTRSLMLHGHFRRASNQHGAHKARHARNPAPRSVSILGPHSAVDRSPKAQAVT
jgi:hypothetical protein